MALPKASSGSRLSDLEQASDQFYTRFIRVGSASIAVVALLAVIGGVATNQLVSIAAGGASLVLNAVVFALTRGSAGLLGRRVFIYGISTIAMLAALFGPVGDQLGVFAVLSCMLVTLAGFALRRGDLLAICAAGILMPAAVTGRQIAQQGWNPQLTTNAITAISLVIVQNLAIFLFVGHARHNQEKLQAYVKEVEAVIANARRIADGDLSGTVVGEGDVSDAVRAMLEGLRTLVTRARDVAAALSSSSQEIAAMSRQQEQGAVEQASAVTEIHRTLATLLDGSSHAAQSTDEVFRNVELTQKTSEVVAQRAAALSTHTRRIAAILEIIKTIANKSEILALNAALEGARAGEAGRGFSLVASQMQRLAESVMESVRDVRALIEDIEAATAATLAATEESTQLSAKATTATRQISGTLQRQRSSTEQVAAAMQDIQHVATQVSVGSSQALSATKDLTRLAAELTRAIEGFRL